MRTLSRVQLVLLSDDGTAPGEKPGEFRIFASGENETSKGSFLFDDAAARSVMAEYQRAGTDVMIDLEHLSLDAQGPRVDAYDARGWCSLEVRDGELWAVNVSWTPDGAERLKNRTQKYVSPAFTVDEETGRITSLVNVALVAMPATYGALPLVASRDMSQNQLRDQLAGLLRAALGVSLGCEGPYICDVFADTVAYEFAGKLYSIAYAQSDAGVSLTGAPVEVIRQYVPTKLAATVRAAKYLAKVRQDGSSKDQSGNRRAQK